MDRQRMWSLGYLLTMLLSLGVFSADADDVSQVRVFVSAYALLL